MTQSRAVIFDLDGTLVDTAPDLVGALNRLLRGLDMPPITREQGRAASGRGGRSLIEVGFALAGRPLPKEEIERLYPLYLEEYNAGLSKESAFYPGVMEALEALARAGWRLGICTNKPERLAERLMRDLGAREMFGALIGADTLPVRKPDPAPFFETLRRLGVEPGRAIMIGDTETDLRTARNAGAPVALARFGYAPDPVHLYRPDALFDDYADFPDLAERLFRMC